MSSLINTSPVRNRTIAPVLAAVFVLTMLVSCASGGGSAKNAPSWVTDPGSVYPESEWVTAVEYGADRQSAQAAAVSSLAKIFRQDVKSETTAFQRYVDAVLNEGAGSEFSESREYAQQVVTTSDIDSLMGVTTSDIWTASDGTVYALARINRKQAAAGYSAMISENEQVVLSFIESAEKNSGTFDACESLGFASDVATVNDNFLDILSVLDPNMARIRRPSYGNAASVRQLAQNALRDIVIAVDIAGDVDGRIARAFASCFSDRGFRTAEVGTAGAGYVLAGSFQIQDMDISTSP
ncbi:MAG: LPP20 family lipoprotein, partial [Spirochaetaceae bacterium]|nr:LPP20 family lipoprotein [Spirochaetaceae bacterium]